MRDNQSPNKVQRSTCHFSALYLCQHHQPEVVQTEGNILVLWTEEALSDRQRSPVQRLRLLYLPCGLHQQSKPGCLFPMHWQAQQVHYGSTQVTSRETSVPSASQPSDERVSSQYTTFVCGSTFLLARSKSSYTICTIRYVSMHCIISTLRAASLVHHG